MHSLVLFASIAVLLSCNQLDAEEGFITVQDYTADHVEPEIDPRSHKPGDVEIYRVNYYMEGYEIIYYHDISGEIRDYHFLKVDTVNYDQGFYNWKNDTTVIVKLYNSKTKQEFKVELFTVRDPNSSGGVRLLN